MTHRGTDPDERIRASAAARRAVIGLARDRGAELTTEPLVPDSDLTISDLQPLDGARTARDIELGARHTARGYIRTARQAGHSWDQIGQALGLTPNTGPGRTGETIAQAAYTYAAGSPHTDTAMRYDRPFLWRCQSCDQAISDHGPVAGPADNEPGHAEDCPRLAAAIAEWDTGWEAEP